MTLATERPADQMPVASPQQQQAAQDRFWAEWDAANPQTPEQVAAFYRDSQGLSDDLDAWHQTPERQTWTKALCYVARETKAQRMLDVGCGAGHDLRALRADTPGRYLAGVEPNTISRRRLINDGYEVFADLGDVPNLESFDLVSCFDMLEHIHEPEAFLGRLASGMRLGSVLVETVGTTDITTPMHLPENQGWHPGHCLETHGFLLLDRQDRFAVWQRVAVAAPPRASLLICAYRALSIPTLTSVMNLAGVSGQEIGDNNEVRITRMATSSWRVSTKYADGLIDRSRSIIVSRWWAETADDVFLMLDDDIVFTPDEAERVVAICREKRSIVCGAYPVGDGSHLAVRQFEGDSVDFGPGFPPKEIEYAATGFMAVHRDVIDAIVKTLPLCHADEPWAFWPMFLPMVKQIGPRMVELSEDWSFVERARALGFKCWLDPQTKLGHLKIIPISVNNMHQIHEAITVKEGG